MDEANPAQRQEMLLLAAMDMQQAAAAARALDRETDFLLRRALETGMAVCYWRPFSKGFKVGARNYVPDDAEFRKLHFLLEERRNKAYAHTTKRAGRSAGTTRDEDDGLVRSYFEQWVPFPRDLIPKVVQLCDAQSARFREEAHQLEAGLDPA